MIIAKCLLLMVVCLGANLSAAKTNAKAIERQTVMADAVFDFTLEKSAVRTFEIQVTKNNEQYVAVVKALLSSGVSQSGQVPCQKKKQDVYFCHRDDDGGEFTLEIGKSPKLIYRYFKTSDDSDMTETFIGSPEGSPFTIQGKDRTPALRK